MLTKPARVVVAFALVLLVGGCVARTAGPDAPPPEPTGAPNRERVVWVDSLCSATTQLETEQATARELGTGPTGEFTEMDVLHYLTFIESTRTSLTDQFESVPEIGIAEADRFVDGIAADLADIKPEVVQLASHVEGLPPAERRARIGQFADLIGSIHTDGVDKLVSSNPEIAAAYELAPRCEPVPEAEDGADLSACADGACEVRLSGTADVKVSDFQFEVTVADGSVTVVHEFGGGTATLSAAENEVRFGTNDQIMTVTLSGISGDTAVIKFTKE